MSGLCFHCPACILFCHLPVSDSGDVVDFCIRTDDKPVPEIIRDSSGILCRISDDKILFGDDLDIRSVVEGIDDQICLARFGICDPESGSPFCRGQLDRYVVVCKIHAVIVRSGDLGLVGEPARAAVLVEYRGADRHNGKLSVVVHPRAWLMCLLEASYLVGSVCIRPAIPHRAGLGSPEIHTPRACDGGIRVACGEFEFRHCAHEHIHIVDIALLPHRGDGTQRQSHK